jgi:hypothetical protein
MSSYLDMLNASAQEKKSGCPHSDVRFCPLYIAAHEAGDLGCDDGKLEGWNGCAVTRALDYGQAIAALWRVKPQLVSDAAFLENAETVKQQRVRNMRAAGLH